MTYTDFHRRVLQLFTTDHALTQDMLRDEWRDYSEATGEQDNAAEYNDLDKVSLAINQRLRKYNMQLSIKKRQANELDGKIYWVLVNTVEDKAAESATMQKEWVIHWFKAVCKFLATHPQGTITATEAISLAQKTSSGKVRGGEVEDKLESLCDEKWLYEVDRSGYYTAGIRTLVELEKLLQSQGAIRCPLTHAVVLKTKKYKEWLKSKGQSLPAAAAAPSQTTQESSESEDSEDE